MVSEKLSTELIYQEYAYAAVPDPIFAAKTKVGIKSCFSSPFSDAWVEPSDRTALVPSRPRRWQLWVQR